MQKSIECEPVITKIGHTKLFCGSRQIEKYQCGLKIARNPWNLQTELHVHATDV